jgi:menaquinone-9 beta-reductase
MTDVCVVGGGPAGLATALALRQVGAHVTIVDCGQPGLDKACGEGLMPDSLAALRELGVHLPSRTGFGFQGVRFADAASSVYGRFPNGFGIGVRRILLHQFLTECALRQGVQIRWGTRGAKLSPGGLSVNGSLLRAGLIVGADGQNSTIRRQAGLTSIRKERRRYGFRRHYRIAPRSDYIELFWGARCQAYFTPVGDQEICLVIISRDPKLRVDEALTEFSELSRRLRNAEPASTEMGAVSASRKLRRVYSGNVALVGDASGSVDAITGEGICLAFKQAKALTDAFLKGDLENYQMAHDQLSARPHAMASLMLSLERHPALQRRAFASLASYPTVFESLLSIHMGESSFHNLFSWKLLPFGASFLAA